MAATTRRDDQAGTTSRRLGRRGDDDARRRDGERGTPGLTTTHLPVVLLPCSAQIGPASHLPVSPSFTSCSLQAPSKCCRPSPSSRSLQLLSPRCLHSPCSSQPHKSLLTVVATLGATHAAAPTYPHCHCSSGQAQTSHALTLAATQVPRLPTVQLPSLPPSLQLSHCTPNSRQVPSPLPASSSDSSNQNA